MSKGLEALTRLRNDECIVLEQYDECYDTIEKELKALEIIKKHKLLNYIFKNKKCANMYHLLEEETELLKEVML